MKNRIFNRNLWLDGCRQMKLLGSVSAVFLVLEAILLPVYRMLVIHETNGGSIASAYLTNRDLVTLHPMAAVVIIFTVPVMTLTLFRFLNQRNASDFYHAVPLTRTCVFLSYSAAVMTWTMCLLWGSTLLSVILHSVLNTGTHILYGTVVIEGISLTIVALLVLGALLLTMSVTGNEFSNIIVTGMILFGPRLLMLAIQLGVGMSTTVVETGKYLEFLGNGWNLLTGYLYGFFVSSSSASDVLSSPQAMVYTLVLALFYLILGWQMYVRRSSEMAGQAAAGSKLQLVFRLTPAFIFTLIPDIIVFDEIAGHSTMDAEEYFLIFILYLLAVILYFLYELISTRKVRNLKGAVPGLLVLVVLDAALIFSMLQMREAILDFCPTAEEIESVSLPASTISVYMGNEGDYEEECPGYLSSRAAKAKITSTEVKKIVADRLERAVEYDEGKNGSESSDSTYGYDSYVTVEITVDGKTTTRVIDMTYQNLIDMAAAMEEEPEVQEAYMNLPSVKDGNLQLYLYGDADALSREAAEHVYEALQQDIQDMGFAEWYTYSSQYVYSEDMRSLTTLNLRYSEGTKVTASSIPISNKTPRAERVYLEEVYQKQDAGVEVSQAMEKLEQLKAAGLTELTDDIESEVSCWADGHMVDDQDISKNFSVSLTEEKYFDLIDQMLNAQTEIAPKEDSIYLTLDLCLNYYVDGAENMLLEEGNDAELTDDYYYLVVILPESMDISEVENVLLSND